MVKVNELKKKYVNKPSKTMKYLAQKYREITKAGYVWEVKEDMAEKLFDNCIRLTTTEDWRNFTDLHYGDIYDGVNSNKAIDDEEKNRMLNMIDVLIDEVKDQSDIFSRLQVNCFINDYDLRNSVDFATVYSKLGEDEQTEESEDGTVMDFITVYSVFTDGKIKLANLPRWAQDKSETCRSFEITNFDCTVACIVKYNLDRVLVHQNNVLYA